MTGVYTVDDDGDMLSEDQLWVNTMRLLRVNACQHNEASVLLEPDDEDVTYRVTVTAQ